MTNTQLYLAYIVPTVIVLLGVFMNRADNLSTRTELRAELATLRAEMIALRNQIHADMVSLHERIAVVESKQRD